MLTIRRPPTLISGVLPAGGVWATGRPAISVVREAEVEELRGLLVDVEAELARVRRSRPVCSDPACVAAHEIEKAHLRVLLESEREELAAELEAAQSEVASERCRSMVHLATTP